MLRRRGLPIDTVRRFHAGPATRQVEQMVWETLEADETPPTYKPLRAVNASELANSQDQSVHDVYAETAGGVRPGS
ncbi:MAG: hypothetical protein M5U34_36125 [Chloroflexi bacterium]|nr:hypothetical protein [Chloroflexota bacterium]